MRFTFVDEFRFVFAYTVIMAIGGYTKQVDFGKLGPTLTIAASLILAIRTARWPVLRESTASAPEWDAEVAHSIQVANKVLAHLLAHKGGLFVQKEVAWHMPDDEDVPK
jgi:hypothetical protein